MQLTTEMDIVVEGWQRKLLQMDRRNARLYFKGRGSAIRIETPNCLTVVESLESSRRGLTFDYLDRPIGRRQQVSLDLVQSGDGDESDSPDEPIVHRGDVVADCPLRFHPYFGARSYIVDTPHRLAGVSFGAYSR